MDFNGLSIDQAPPISAPLRFFLTAPLFAILAGFLIFFSDSATLMSRYSMSSIAITHAMTLGFLSFVMLGAMTQMLPVLASAKIPKVQLLTTLAHALLGGGTLFMILGFLQGSSFYNTLAFVGLGSGFFIILSAIAYSLFGVANYTATVKAMATSIVFAFFTVAMGLYLLYAYIFNDISSMHLVVANVHSVWGVFGFAGILIIGVSFQVLPMFYVAPKFKSFCKQKVVWLITFGLLLWLFLSFYFEAYAFVGKIWIALFFWAYATTAWHKLNKRRRPISDVTVWYWRSASLFLTLGVFVWVLDEYFKHEYIVLAALLIGGFILSVMVGMLYKIIPFLVWFHLNAKGYMSIPTINEMINKNLAKLQFVLFLSSFVGFIFSFYLPQVLQISALSFIISMIVLQYNIIAPVLIYKKVLKTKPDFDMSSFA